MKLNNLLRNFLLVLGMSLLLTACAVDINSDNNPTNNVDVTQNLEGPYIGDDIYAADRFRTMYGDNTNTYLTAYLNSQNYDYMDILRTHDNYSGEINFAKKYPNGKTAINGETFTGTANAGGVTNHWMLYDYFGIGTPWYQSIHNIYFDWTLTYDEHEESYCETILQDEWIELEELYEHEELIEACRERIAELVATNGWSSGDIIGTDSDGNDIIYYPFEAEANVQIIPVNEVNASKASAKFPHSYHQDLARYTSLINDCTSNCHIRYGKYSEYSITTGRGTYSVSPISANSQWITTYTKIPLKEKIRVGDSTYNNQGHNFCWSCHANLPSPYRAPHGYIAFFDDAGNMTKEVQPNGNCTGCHALGLGETTATGSASLRDQINGVGITDRADYATYYWDNTTQNIPGCDDETGCGDNGEGVSYNGDTVYVDGHYWYWANCENGVVSADTCDNVTRAQTETGALREDILGTKPLVTSNPSINY